MITKTLAELLVTHRELAKEYLPSGSGFDAGSRIWEVTPYKITIETEFHHMDENGYYDGWTTHKIKAYSTFNGNEIFVTGKDRNHIKDYISETFHHVLFVQKYALLFNAERKSFSIIPVNV